MEELVTRLSKKIALRQQLSMNDKKDTGLNMGLTNNEDLTQYLLSDFVEKLKEEWKMRGRIRPISRQRRCPDCGVKFVEVRKLGYICPVCKKRQPRRLYLDVYWNKQRLPICSDTTGQALDSYDRALKLLEKINAELDSHTFDPARYVASAQKDFYAKTLLEKFFAAKKKSIAPSYTGYSVQVERAKTFFGNRDVRDVRESDLLAYLEFLKKQKQKNGKTLRAKTIRNNYDNIVTFFNWLKEEGVIKETHVPSKKKVDEAMEEVELSEEPFNYVWFDSEDQIRILDAIEVAADEELVRFMMLHGCRPGEARALRVSKVNIREESVLIDSTFSKNVIRPRRKGKKAKPYKIAIHHEMMDFFSAKIKNSHPEAFIFVNPRTGGPYMGDAYRDIFVAVRNKLGIPSHVRLYDATKHSFVSQLRTKGASMEDISKSVGHSSTKMTEKVYNHAHGVDVERQKAMISRLSLKKKSAEIIDIESAKKKLTGQ